MKNRKGFSLVELLAVIAILGILAVAGIVGVTRIIEKSKAEKNASEVKTATFAAKSYLQANKEIAPKSIGESTTLTLQDLKDTKYLTEDLVNAKGENCMEHSYVEIIKTGKNSYDYEPHIYCGSEIPEDEGTKDPPVLKKGIIFSDANDVSVASFSFTLLGSANNSDEEIASYTYVISTKLNGQTDYQEVYNSGVIAGNDQKEININEKIKKYVDLTGTTSVRITVIARNESGGKLEESAVTGTGKYSDFKDTVPPYCEADSANNLQYTQAEVGDWFNYEDYKKAGRGKSIQVKCLDGDGSGCLRNIFTQTWPNNQVVDENGTKPYLYGAKYAWIYIKDNSGNSGKVVNTLPSDWNDNGDPNHRNDGNDYRCLVRVNVDILPPEVTLNVKATENGKVLATKTAGGLDSNGNRRKDGTEDANEESIMIEFDSYSDLADAVDGHKWFNSTNSPTGPIIEFTAKDNIQLDRWVWETNVGGVPYKTTYSGNETKVSTAGDDSELASFNSPNNLFFDTAPYSKTVTFATDGVRFGKLTVYDKAGNKTVINVKAYVDKTAPNIKNTTIATKYLIENKVAAEISDDDYQEQTWTNKYVMAYIKKADKDKETVSGFSSAKYNVYNEEEKIIMTESNDTNRKSYYKGPEYNEEGLSAFVFTNTFEGKNKIEFALCDVAGNCSNYLEKKAVVWLDTTPPDCTMSQKVNKQADSADGALSPYGWAGLNETITVTATCSDPSKNGISTSKCKVETLSHEYKDDINTTKAGAAGNGNGGTFYDVAGNSKKCPATETVKIDHKEPSCTTSISYAGGDGKTNDGWLMATETATVTATCKDEAVDGVVSQCVKNSFSHTYTTEIETTKAGAVADKNDQNISGGSVTDQADNVTQCPADKTVKIDKTKPKCEMTTKYYNSNKVEISKSVIQNNQKGWLKKGEYATVTGKCSDTGGSKCKTTNNVNIKSYNYKTTTTLNINDAGPNGRGVKVTFTDVAGNESDPCPTNINIKIDAVAPTCYTEGCDNTTWSNQNRTYKYGCQDTNGSGCATALASGTVETTKNSLPLSYDIVDVAGNKTSCSKTCNVLVDKILPTGTCTVKGNKITLDSKSDDHSGVSAVHYMSKIKKETPGIDSNAWSTSTSLGTSCGKTYYGYIKVIDKAGNSQVVGCGGSYTTGACCSASNPWGCTWKTACRNGRTFIYTSSAKTTYAGTVYHQKGSSCSDRLYLIEKSGSKKLYIHSPCNKISWYSAAKKPYAYIYSNCIGGQNSVCPYANCPG